MYSKVKRLRERGERKSDHAIAADPGLVGHVTVVLVENVPVIKIYAAGDDGTQKPAWPEMHRALCVTMHGDKMLWRGLEMVTGQPVPQEWSMQIMQDQPAEMKTRSHRP